MVIMNNEGAWLIVLPTQSEHPAHPVSVGLGELRSLAFRLSLESSVAADAGRDAAEPHENGKRR
jgi:hypothetical protein